MRDYKYKAFASRRGEIPDWGWHLKDFRSESLRQLTETFNGNLIRTSTFALIPAWIALEATREQLWLDHATVVTGGKIDPDLSTLAKRECPEEFAKVFDGLVAEYRMLPRETVIEFLDEIGVDYIERRLQLPELKAVSVAIEAIYSTVVIESWMAFEILVADLWLAAVNSGPAQLAQNVNLSNKQERVDEKIAHHWKNKLQVDPRTDFTKALMEVGRVSFKRLDQIIRWYSVTFENDVHKLFDEVEGGYIYALSAYRNALVHNAGLVDKDFIKQIEPVDSLRGTFQENQRLELDGELVTKLRAASVTLGRKLIQFVDRIITPP
jgi:hypothetical protein